MKNELPSGMRFYTVALRQTLNQVNDQQKEVILELLDKYTARYKEIKAQVDEVSLSVGFHEQISKEANRLFDDPEMKDKISCRAGCGFCCYQYVVATDDEAKTLIEYSNEQKINLNWDKIKLRANLSEESWKKLPHKDRKCVFLGEDQKCTVYEHRPAVCRKLYVVNDPVLCDSSIFPEGEVLWATSTMAEIIASAMYNATRNDSLDKMLLENKDYVQPE